MQGSSKQLLPLLLLIFIDSFGYFLVLPVLLRLYMPSADHTAILPSHDSLAFRNLLYGITMALSPLAMIFSAPVIGHISDIKGRKKTLFYCLLAAIIGFAVPILGIVYRKVSLIIIGRLIAGGSSASQPIAQAAITDFSTGKQKAFYLSLIAFAMTLAMMLGPLAGGYLSDPHWVHWFSVTTPYWAGTLLTILNLILILSLYRESHSVKNTQHPLFRAQWQQLRHAITQKPVCILLLVFILLEIAWSQYYQSVFLVLTEKFHYTPSQISVFTAYIGVWMCIGLTVVYKVALRFISVKQMLLVSLVGAAIGFTGFIVSNTGLWHWLFVIPSSVFIGTGYTSLVATISNRSDPEHQGWILGTVSTLLGLAWLITGLSSGIMVSIDYLLPLIIAAASMCIATVLYLPQHKQQ